MDPFLPHEIKLLVLRHLVREGCPETVQSYINENSRVKEVLAINNKSFQNGDISIENCREVLEGPSPNAGLKEILAEYGRAKMLVHNLVKKLFEWKLLSPYYLSPYDTLATQLYHIENLINSKCKERKLTESKRIGTSDFPEFSKTPLELERRSTHIIDCIDVETQTTDDVEIENDNEEVTTIPAAVQQTLPSFMDPAVVEKIVNLANKALQKKGEPDGTVVEIPKVSSTEIETESEIDKMLLEILLGDEDLANTSNNNNDNDNIHIDNDIDLNTPINSPHHDTNHNGSGRGGTSSSRAETSLIEMFKEAGTVIETTPISGTLINIGPEDSILSSSKSSSSTNNNSQNQAQPTSAITTSTLVSTPSSSSFSPALSFTSHVQPKPIAEANYSMIKAAPTIMNNRSGSSWQTLRRRKIVPIIPGNENKRNAAPPSIKIQNRRRAKLVSPRKLTQNITTTISTAFATATNTNTTTTNNNNSALQSTSAVSKDNIFQNNYSNDLKNVVCVESMEVEIIVPDIVNNVNLAPSTSHTTTENIQNDNENNTETLQNESTNNLNEQVSSSSSSSLQTEGSNNIQQSNNTPTNVNTTTTTPNETKTTTTSNSIVTEIFLESNSNSHSLDETPTASQSVQRMREHPSFINRKSYTSPRKNNHIRSLVFKTPPGSKSERFENELASRPSFTGTPLKRALSYVSKFDFTLKKRLKLDGVVADESTKDNDENFNRDSAHSPSPHSLLHNKILSPITESSMSQINDDHDMPNLNNLSQKMREIHESPDKHNNKNIPIICVSKNVEQAINNSLSNTNSNNILQSTTNLAISTTTTSSSSNTSILPENIPMLLEEEEEEGEKEQENENESKTRNGKTQKKQPKRKCKDKKQQQTSLPSVEAPLTLTSSTIKQRKTRTLRESKVKQDTSSFSNSNGSSENVEQVETSILVSPSVICNEVPLNYTSLALTSTSKTSKALEEQEDGEIVDDSSSSNSCGSRSPVIDIITLEDTNSNSKNTGQNYNKDDDIITASNRYDNSNNNRTRLHNSELAIPSSTVISTQAQSYNEERMKHPKKRILPQPVPPHWSLPVFPPPISTSLPIPKENPPKEYILSIPSDSYEDQKLVNQNLSSKQSFAKSLGLSFSSDSEMDSSVSDTPITTTTISVSASGNATVTQNNNNNNNSTIIATPFNSSGENMRPSINMYDVEKQRFDLSSSIPFMSSTPLTTSTPGTQNNNSSGLNTSLSLLSPSLLHKTTTPIASIFDTPSKPGDIHWNAGQKSESPRKSSTLSKLMDAALRRKKSNTPNKSELTSPSFTIQPSSSFPTATITVTPSSSISNTMKIIAKTIISTPPVTSHSNSTPTSHNQYKSSRHSSNNTSTITTNNTNKSKNSSSSTNRKGKIDDKKDKKESNKVTSSSSRTQNNKSHRLTPVKRESQSRRTSSSGRRRSRSRSREKSKEERETKSRRETYSRRKHSTSFRYTPPIDLGKRKSTRNRSRRERSPEPRTSPPRTTNETNVDKRRKSSRREETGKSNTSTSNNTKISKEKEQLDKTLEPSSSNNKKLVVTTAETKVTSTNIPISNGLPPILEPLTSSTRVRIEVSEKPRKLTISETGQFNITGMLDFDFGKFQQPPFLLPTPNISPRRDIINGYSSTKPQPQHILKDVNIDRFLSSIHPDYHV